MQEAGKLTLVNDGADTIDVPGKESHRVIIPWCYNLMKMLSMYDEFLSKISSDFINVGGVRTAYYFYNGNSNKTILLIHGIGGDFHGMIPLAYRLRDDANLLFVDLPSHGKSQLISNMEVSDIEYWARNLLPVFKQRDLPINEIVAHSLGCLAASKTGCPKIWYINPPFETPIVTKISSSFLYHVRWINQHIYLNYYFSVFRGMCLIRNRQKSTISLIKWLTRKTRVTSRQYLEQAKIARDVSRMEKMVIPESKFTGLIVGRFDKITCPTGASGVRIDKFVELNTGHLSVLDSPELISKLILSEE